MWRGCQAPTSWLHFVITTFCNNWECFRGSKEPFPRPLLIRTAIKLTIVSQGLPVKQSNSDFHSYVSFFPPSSVFSEPVKHSTAHICSYFHLAEAKNKLLLSGQLDSTLSTVSLKNSGNIHSLYSSYVSYTYRWNISHFSKFSVQWLKSVIRAGLIQGWWLGDSFQSNWKIHQKGIQYFCKILGWQRLGL